MLHLNGFLPVCTRLCADKHELSEYALSHMSHLNGFSPVCDLLCRMRLERFVYDFSHKSQLNVSFPCTTLNELFSFLGTSENIDSFIYNFV